MKARRGQTYGAAEIEARLAMSRSLTVLEIAEIDFATLPQVQAFPAMQFYPPDWLTGTATRAMTAEQRGGFIDLLAEAWIQKPPCSLPNDDAKLAGLSRVGAARWPKVGQLIREQFVECADGRLRNPKQFAVWLDSIRLRETRRKYRGMPARSKRRLSVFRRDNYTCVYCGTACLEPAKTIEEWLQ